MYRTLKIMIEKNQTVGIAERLDIFFAAGKLVEADHNEPTAMLKERG